MFLKRRWNNHWAEKFSSLLWWHSQYVMKPRKGSRNPSLPPQFLWHHYIYAWPTLGFAVRNLTVQWAKDSTKTGNWWRLGRRGTRQKRWAHQPRLNPREWRSVRAWDLENSPMQYVGCTVFHQGESVWKPECGKIQTAGILRRAPHHQANIITGPEPSELTECSVSENRICDCLEDLMVSPSYYICSTYNHERFRNALSLFPNVGKRKKGESLKLCF